MVLTFSRRKHGRKVSYKSNKRIWNTVNSHVNSSESNNMNTWNSDNVIGNSNLPNTNVQTESSLNTLITLQTEKYTESSISINNEKMDGKIWVKKYNLIKIQNWVIDNTCDDNGNNFLNY